MILSNEICKFCDNFLHGTKYTVVISDPKGGKVSLVGHDECTAEAVDKVKSYKNYEKLSVNELLKRLNVQADIEYDK